MSNSEKNEIVVPDTTSKEVTRNFYIHYVAAANAQDLDAIAAMIQDDILLNGAQQKKEDAIASFKWLLDVMPDYKWILEELFIDGDRIAARLSDSGTPVKPFFGAEPNGATIEFTEYSSYKLSDGLFAEMRFLLDSEKIKEQLKQ